MIRSYIAVSSANIHRSYAPRSLELLQTLINHKLKNCSRKGQILCFINSEIYKIRVAIDCIILCATSYTLKRITRVVKLQIPARSFDSISEAKLTYVSVASFQFLFNSQGLRSCEDARVPCKRHRGNIIILQGELLCTVAIRAFQYSRAPAAKDSGRVRTHAYSASHKGIS